MEATLAKLRYYPETCLDEFENTAKPPQSD
jgi:hypothetical protein